MNYSCTDGPQPGRALVIKPPSLPGACTGTGAILVLQIRGKTSQVREIGFLHVDHTDSVR